MGWAKFLGASRSDSGGSFHLFPEIDIDAMAKRLRLRERARERGGNNIPKADGHGFDAVEQEIVKAIEDVKIDQYQKYIEMQQSYADQASELMIGGEANKFHNVVANTKARFGSEASTGHDELCERRDEVDQTFRERDRYRDEHRLERPPRHYERRGRKIGFLILILALEAVLNGFFLAEGSTFGLIGGVFEALIIAAINVAVGCGVGRLVVPWIIYRSRLARALGMLGLTTYFIFVIGFNLAVAHYRSAIVKDPFKAAELAYHSLILDPLAISDLQSWGLCVVGIIFSILAAVDGWLMDDPYPGYGQRMRHRREARRVYNDRKRELQDDLEEIHDDAEREMDDIVRSIQARKRMYPRIVNRWAAKKTEIRNHFSHLKRVGNTLLEIYRDENIRFRTEPPPRHFKNAEAEWDIEIPTVDEDTPAIEDSDHSDETVQKLLRSIPQRREESRQAYQKALNVYEEISLPVDLEVSP